MKSVNKTNKSTRTTRFRSNSAEIRRTTRPANATQGAAASDSRDTSTSPRASSVSPSGDVFGDVSPSTRRSRRDSAPARIETRNATLPKNTTSPLVDLMMGTGALETKIGKDKLEGVKKVFAAMKAVDTTPYDEKRGKLVELGRIVIEQESDGSLKWSTRGDFGVYGAHKGDVKKLLTDLLSSNGQLDYIKKQDWFTSKEFDVVVDVNYYIDRPIESWLGFHKDTGGTNLFVNLVFDNPDTIVGTEWTQDRRLPAKERMALLQKWMPASMLDSIMKAKVALNSVGAPGRNTIQGGTLPAYAFVSWVDELVWHSTPFLDHRAKITNSKEYVQQVIEQRLEQSEAYTIKRAELEAEFDQAITEDEQQDINAQLTALDDKEILRLATLEELVFAIATTPGTRLAAHLNDKGYSPELEGYDATAVLEALSVYADKTTSTSGSQKKLAEDIAKVAWDKLPGFSTQIGISNDLDPNIPGSRQIKQATEIGNRPRANSTLVSKGDPNNLQTLAKKSPKRTFLRTWVRVERKVQRRVIDAFESVSPEEFFDEVTAEFLPAEFDAWFQKQFPDAPPIKLDPTDFDRVNDILANVIASIDAARVDVDSKLWTAYYTKKATLLTALIDRLASTQRPPRKLIDVAEQFPEGGALSKDYFKQWVEYLGGRVA